MAIGLVGCAAPEKTESGENSSTVTTSTPAADLQNCAGCNHEMPVAEMMDVDGKMMCESCANASAGATGEMVDCPCGTQIAKAEAKEIDGKLVCSECATKMMPADNGGQ